MRRELERILANVKAMLRNFHAFRSDHPTTTKFLHAPNPAVRIIL